MAPVCGGSAGPRTERSACLAVGVGAAASYECGDLRLVHTLPVTTTMGRARAPDTGGYTQQFDLLNRVWQRTVAARTFPRERCAGLMASSIADPVNLSLCFVVFPAYPHPQRRYPRGYRSILLAPTPAGRLNSPAASSPHLPEAP